MVQSLIQIKEKKKELDRYCVNMLQYSNDETMFCFWQRSQSSITLKLGTCLNCLSLVNMLQYITCLKRYSQQNFS